MTIKQFLIACSFSILIFTSVRSQSHSFGKITEEEWNMERCSFDTAAQALVLFDVGTITIRTRDGEINSDPYCKLQPKFFRMVSERHKRVKILNKEGIKAASLSFTLRFVNGKKDILTYFKCIEVHMVNGKEITKKFALKNLIESVEDDGSVFMTFSLPETTDGSIVDLAYTIESQQFDATPDWDFSDKSPTLYSEINLVIPEFCQGQKLYTKFKNLKYESFTKVEKFSVTYLTSWEGMHYSIFTFDVNHEKYTLSSIPAYQKSEDTFHLKYIFNNIDYASVPFIFGRTSSGTGKTIK